MSQSKEQKRKVPTVWHAVGVGVTIGVLVFIVVRFVYGPPPNSIEEILLDIFSIEMLIVCVPSTLGAFIGLRKRTIKAVWIGAIIGELFLPLLIVSMFYLIFGTGLG